MLLSINSWVPVCCRYCVETTVTAGRNDFRYYGGDGNDGRLDPSPVLERRRSHAAAHAYKRMIEAPESRPRHRAPRRGRTTPRSTHQLRR